MEILMEQKIHIIKGTIDNIKIHNSVFTLLKPINVEYGKVTAIVDASRLFGSSYKQASVSVADYRIIE